ncbi:MAG: L-asparaginase [Rhodobacterales bacterium]|nr:MAG: L-asparaginase [Rhodobacterales bacterium]
MTAAPVLAEVFRGGHQEGQHRGHAVICGPDGEVIEAWGDPGAVIFPRSSCKMVQALPLVESGAADAFGLTSAQLALACASHEAAPIHNDAVRAWLSDLGLNDSDLECGPQPPRDREVKHGLIREGHSPCRVHNNCSGKHAGFLTLAKHLKAPTEGYVLPDHPVQQAARAALEDTAGETAQGYGIDGCSAPNYRVTLAGLGRSMASFAAAGARSDARSRAQSRLVDAMRSHPLLVAGNGRACTELMQAGQGRFAVKTGAEAVFIAILPETGHSIALKIEDGATRASEAVIAALLVRLGAVEPAHPLVQKRMNAVLRNFAGQEVGEVRAVAGLSG